jgi:hypothetical protein
MSTNSNQAQLKSKATAMLAGWAKTGVFTPPSITVRGQVLTGPGVQQQVQAFLDLLEGPDRALAAYRAAVAIRRAGMKAGLQFLNDLADVTTQHFGDQEAHQRFGIPMPKTAALPSVETRVLANDQRQKTRKARGVMGRRQREAMTGPKEQLVIVHSGTAPTVAAGLTGGKAEDSSS